MTPMRVTAALLCATLVGFGSANAQESHAHIGHVMTGWQDTPDGAGLLPTAQKEAEIALQHAELALTQPEDIEFIRLHSGHVLHAIDPLAVEGGPGLGYGLEQAAAGTAAHINLAAGAQDASDNVKLHAEHVAASTRNVITWSGEAVRLIRQIMTNDNAKHANIMAGSVKNLLVCVINGCDANTDGTIDWGPGEGGLAQAYQHMTVMMQREGMI